MRRLLAAAAFGLGLLSAGAAIDPAAAAPFQRGPSASATHEVAPVQYRRYDHDRGYHRPHYAPPRHYGHRYEPPRRYGHRYEPPRHVERYQPRNQYGYRR